MDDLSATIGRILSDPDSVRQLQQAAASLGLSGDAQSPPGPKAVAQPPRPGRTMAGRRSTYTPPQPAAQKEEELAALRQMLGQMTQSPAAAPPQQAPAPEVDLGALSEILAGLTGTAPSIPEPEPQPSGGLNLSALSNILGNLGGSQPQQQSNSTPDLSSLLGALGGGQQQSNNTPDLSSLLGALGGGQQQSNNTPDLSSLLGALGGGQQQSTSPDLSELQGILSGLTGGNSGGNSGGGKPSTASTLADMLGGPGAAGAGASSPLGGMDLGMLLKFQQAMSGMSANAGNVRLLLSVKNHLKDEARKAKVDDAIRVMQVIQFLPILKESGLFGKLEEILDGIGMGGIGSALGGLGNLGGGGSGGLGGLGSLLGSLTGRR